MEGRKVVKKIRKLSKKIEDRPTYASVSCRDRWKKVVKPVATLFYQLQRERKDLNVNMQNVSIRERERGRERDSDSLNCRHSIQCKE